MKKTRKKIVSCVLQSSHILKTILKKNEYFRDREPYCEDSINLRMGLIIIEDIKAYDIIMGDKSNWRIVWSNSIKLKKE